MKYFIFALCCLASSCISAQNKQRQIKMADNSLSKNEIKKIAPEFLDTILRQNEDGTMLMQIAVRKGLDTAYVEDPETGALTMLVNDPRKKKAPINKETKEPTRDTVYVENPISGEIHMILVTNTLPKGNWQLRSINNTQDAEMERVNMFFEIDGDEKTVSGNDGCNAYSASIKNLTINQIEFETPLCTKRACIDAAKHADAFYAGLSQITQYSCSGKNLSLKDSEGKIRLFFVRADK